MLLNSFKYKNTTKNVSKYIDKILLICHYTYKTVAEENNISLRNRDVSK